MTSPVVSICSSVLDQSDWLKKMLTSVVEQTYKDWELILVDDGSTEDIKAVVDSFKDDRIKLIRWDENRGMPHGMNHALSKAGGKYTALLSADELIWKEKLAIQVEYMEAHQGVDCVWGLPLKGPLGPRPVYEQTLLRAHNRSNAAWLRTLLNLENVPIGGASLLMKTEVMKSLDYLDPKMKMFSDHELFCKFFSRGHTGIVLPYRFAVEHTTEEDADVRRTQRFQNFGKMDDELGIVRSRYPMPTPAVTGKISIGIPCYNHAKYLPDSVHSALAQTHQDIEVMILNDGGTDDFNTVVQQFTDPRVKVMAFPENMGVWEAQNQMAFRASGEFYIPLGADDIIEPNFIEKCLAKFAENPWLELVVSQTDFIKEDGSAYNTPDNPMMNIQKVAQGSREEMLLRLYGGNAYHGAGMYRTRVISDVGGWEKQYKVITDYQMYLKLLQREVIGVIEENLTHTRVDGKNLSLLDKKKAAELPWLYHAAKKPFYRQQQKVIIATPFYELKGFSPYISSLTATLRLMHAHGIDCRFMELSGDSYVHRARNTMCDLFLSDPDNTDLFFIDSDMSWNPEAFLQMCLRQEEILGGSYPVKNCWDLWTSIPEVHEEDGKNVMKGKYLSDGSALIEAHVLAGGFLRIKRSVLEKFREHYPDLWYYEPSSTPDEPFKKFTQFFGAESINHKFHGEDHMFSKHLRDMGVQMFIYPNVDITHWGYKNFSGNFDRYLKEKSAQDRAPLQQPAAPMAAS